jgi:prepilin-type N-terminal cleavage/methylation domain-containing protein
MRRDVSNDKLPFKPDRSRGFTLVELLVVVGIIGVLIAILLPVLAKARAQANRVACLSNIRQLGTGILMYCNDNDGYFPTCAAWGSGSYVPYPEDWVHWQQSRDINSSAIARYVGYGDQLKSLLRCPADSFEGRKPHIGIDPGQGPYLYSYGMNEALASNARGLSWRTKITQWRSPARKIMLTEMREIYTDAGWWGPTAPLAWRHGTAISRGTPNGLLRPGERMGANVSAVFIDGHAEGINDDFACNFAQVRPDYRLPG